MIHVFGHLNPDTDAICSSIAYAWHLSTNKGQEAQAFALGSINKETEYVLRRFNLDLPQVLKEVPADALVTVVDTNNPEELPASITEATLVEIVDHHKLVGGLHTADPVTVTMRQVGCTATIVWQLMQADGVTELPQDIAGAMLAAIISDTLEFTSPTTTEADKSAALALGEIVQDHQNLAEEMFVAKSDLTGMDPSEIITMDSKVMEVNGTKVRISTLETVAPERALVLKDSLLEAIKAQKAQDQNKYLFFFIVDVLRGTATLLLESEMEEEVAKKAFNSEIQEQTMILPGVVSRKKQMVPPIEKALS